MVDNNISYNSIEQAKVSVVTYILVCVFGIGSWLALNGIWVELPNLIHELPEGWKLASYITVICQLGNIGTIFYLLLRKILPKNKLQHYTILVTTFLGGVSFIMLSQYWDRATFVFHEYRSVTLFFFVLIVAVVDCTSSVTFLPFMAILPDVYMSALFVGESMTALLPGVVALIQGSYVEHYVNETVQSQYPSQSNNGLLFPQEIFFIILSIIMFLSPISYLCLRYLPSIKRIHIRPINDSVSTHDVNFSRLSNSDSITSVDHAVCFPDVNKPLMLFILMSLNTLQNGIIMSISSFAYQPYGNLVYHLSASLGAVAAALSCFLYLWFPTRSPKCLYILTFIYMATAVVIFSMALQSPNPFLKTETIGKILAVLMSILSNALVYYLKLSIVSIMKCCRGNFLLYSGIVIQLGSFIGSIVMFPIINFTNTFKSR